MNVCKSRFYAYSDIFFSSFVRATAIQTSSSFTVVKKGHIEPAPFVELPKNIWAALCAVQFRADSALWVLVTIRSPVTSLPMWWTASQLSWIGTIVVLEVKASSSILSIVLHHLSSSLGSGATWVFVLHELACEDKTYGQQEENEAEN